MVAMAWTLEVWLICLVKDSSSLGAWCFGEHSERRLLFELQSGHKILRSLSWRGVCGSIASVIHAL